MAQRFHLAVGDVLQGDSSIRSRTLLLVFQVNCPGCLTYALPQAEAIHRNADRLGLRVLALSTAFEDFDLNTVENTRALIERGVLVGASRQHLGVDTYAETLTLPVAVDAGMDRGVGETFAVNGLPGTPTWILLESEDRVVGSAFGRLPADLTRPATASSSRSRPRA